MANLNLYEVCIPGHFGLNFKVPIWTDGIELSSEDDLEIQTYCQQKILEHKTTNKDYVKNTWHEKNLFSEELHFVDKLKQKIINSYKTFIDAYGAKQEKIWINGWINLLTKNENLIKHCHAMHENSYLSGVVVLSNCNNTSTNFYLPQLEHVPEIGVLKISNTKGDIIMFPQWLYHSVETITQDVRITMGFDLFNENSINFFNSNKNSLPKDDWPIQRAIRLL